MRAVKRSEMHFYISGISEIWDEGNREELLKMEIEMDVLTSNPSRKNAKQRRTPENGD